MSGYVVRLFSQADGRPVGYVSQNGAGLTPSLDDARRYSTVYSAQGGIPAFSILSHGAAVESLKEQARAG